jgi:hypothetical protein
MTVTEMNIGEISPALGGAMAIGMNEFINM